MDGSPPGKKRLCSLRGEGKLGGGGGAGSLEDWILGTHRNPERKRIQSPLFPGPTPISALQISYGEG